MGRHGKSENGLDHTILDCTMTSHTEISVLSIDCIILDHTMTSHTEGSLLSNWDIYKYIWIYQMEIISYLFLNKYLKKSIST